MGRYVKRWQTITAKFETDAKIKRPRESVTKVVLTVSKASVLTPALEHIGNALDKVGAVPRIEVCRNIRSRRRRNIPNQTFTIRRRADVYAHYRCRRLGLGAFDALRNDAWRALILRGEKRHKSWFSAISDLF